MGEEYNGDGKKRAMKMLTFHIPFTLHSIVIATIYDDLR